MHQTKLSKCVIGLIEANIICIIQSFLVISLVNRIRKIQFSYPDQAFKKKKLILFNIYRLTNNKHWRQHKTTLWMRVKQCQRENNSSLVSSSLSSTKLSRIQRDWIRLVVEIQWSKSQCDLDLYFWEPEQYCRHC